MSINRSKVVYIYIFKKLFKKKVCYKKVLADKSKIDNL